MDLDAVREVLDDQWIILSTLLQTVDVTYDATFCSSSSARIQVISSALHAKIGSIHVTWILVLFLDKEESGVC